MSISSESHHPDLHQHSLHSTLSVVGDETWPGEISYILVAVLIWSRCEDRVLTSIRGLFNDSELDSFGLIPSSLVGEDYTKSVKMSSLQLNFTDLCNNGSSLDELNTIFH
ncbi:PREDICTED: uncharacterized protein LOC101299326 [Fragaria vesca subsp. vesca]